MILTRWAVCSERKKKAVTRVVCDSKAECERALELIQRQDAADPEEEYWMVELGPESEVWRWLAPEK